MHGNDPRETGHKQTHNDAKLHRNQQKLSEVFFNWLQKWGQLYCFGYDNQVFLPRDGLGFRTLTAIMQSVFELRLQEIHQLLADLPPTRL